MSVPRIRLETVEAIARKILMEYDSSLLSSEPRPIPIEAIIEVKFDLILEYHILRKNGAVLGETIFDDGPVILYDMDERSYKIIAVRKGTILIDERLCETRSIGRLRFTCAHELAHWVLHKNLYSGTGNIAAYNGQCSTDESDGVIERQADALATALLMPLPQIKKCFYRLRSGRTMEQIVAEMAQIFEVSKQAISGRARLFEVVQKVAEVNARRRQAAPGRQLTGSSWNDPEVQNDPSLALDYIVAPPRMAHYIDWSTKIYGVYLKYLAPEDIFPYSIDEVFMDVTNYLDTYKMTARDLARTIILDILKTTGITAAAGMGPNLYLAKIAMDIVAKHVHPDKDGVRIAKLNEMTYRQLLWTHRPLTDFWRIGRGYATKLEAHGLYTMGDIARCSIGKPTDYHNEEMLYRLFGVNAELLIDHAWGWEPCTIADVKAYKPENKSIVSGQVLQCPYSFDKARLVVREMADALALDLVDKGLVTTQLVLTVGYDIENLVFTQCTAAYTGAVTTDRYGRKIPKHAVGTENFSYTSSANDLLEAVTTLYDRIVDRTLLIRRLSISANRLLREDEAPKQDETEQLDLFTDYVAREEQQAEYEAEHARERKIQKTMLRIKKKFGKNAILKGMNLEDGATARERNQTIGGHQA